VKLKVSTFSHELAEDCTVYSTSRKLTQQNVNFLLACCYYKKGKSIMVSISLIKCVVIVMMAMMMIRSVEAKTKKHKRALTSDGLHIPHDLRRDDAFKLLEIRRKELMRSMEEEDLSPEELSKMEKILEEVDQKEEKLAEEVETDANAWHEVHARRGKLVDERIARLKRWKKEGRKETKEEKDEFLKELRVIEREEADIRMNHFRTTPEERDEIHTARDYYHDVQHDRNEAKKRGDTAEYQRLTPIMEEAHDKYVELMRPLHDREHDEL
jgi:hypothetical protein